jgi:hypothetical protein
MNKYLLILLTLFSNLILAQPKFTIIEKDSLVNGELYNYKWNFNVLPINDSEIILNQWGSKELNGIGNAVIYSDYKFNYINNTRCCSQQYIENVYSKWHARYNGFELVDSNHFFCLNPMLRIFGPDSTGYIKSLQYCGINMLDNSLNTIWSKIIGDSNKHYLPASSAYSNKKIYLGATKSNTPSVIDTKVFNLFKVDLNGNVLFEKEYWGPEREYLINTQSVNNNIYLSGIGKPLPYWDEKYYHVIRKVDTNGNFIKSKIFQFRLNTGYFFSSNYVSNGEHRLIGFNCENPVDSVELSSLSHNNLRVRLIDTNLNITSTKIIELGLPAGIMNITKIREDKFLVIGAKYTNPDLLNLGAWAILVDTAGKVIWDRTYILRADVDHYINDGVATSDGGYLMVGSVFGSNKVNERQDGFIIKVDSLGCLDINTACYPTSITESVINPISISVYPNPTKSDITVNLPKVPATITIHNLYGQTMYKQMHSTNKLIINCSNWPQGIYQLSTTINNKAYNIKFLKQ